MDYFEDEAKEGSLSDYDGELSDDEIKLQPKEEGTVAYSFSFISPQTRASQLARTILGKE